MAQPSLIYFASDTERNLLIQITKDLEVALMLEQRAYGKPLSIVRVEEFETMRQAVERLRRITRMSRARRRRLVERGNPQWKSLVREPVTPSGDAEFSIPKPAMRGFIGEPPDDNASGGVLARVPTPPSPRSGSDAKQPPRLE